MVIEKTHEQQIDDLKDIIDVILQYYGAYSESEVESIPLNISRERLTSICKSGNVKLAHGSELVNIPVDLHIPTSVIDQEVSEPLNLTLGERTYRVITNSDPQFRVNAEVEYQSLVAYEREARYRRAIEITH
jgi:hypothetical protein